ncbi:hypothetical protein AJ79_09082 [Helicocarpus griseus UAMH5409]|uniref:GP-PDE domain-containing protein n=1 Tax=Helicocarpus griseus UAMH5409 TaxID=1447875 RepID=A0A2B7WM98_9EURO|nr:hypothetical protein AJ79_09082 [Helicocarpus griseus UAMH5409]
MASADIPTFENVTATFNLQASPSAANLESQPGPDTSWVAPGRNNDGTPAVPLTIAHRGLKAKYPENTMSGFTHAVEVGAQGLEVDLHLSKDGVVVISHDATLQRCYGVSKRIIDCDWAYLSSLRTTRAPFEPMPRLIDLLQYISAPDRTHVWLLLDIKLDDDSESMVRAIAETIESVPSERRPWNERIILGCWAAKYLSLCHKYLPSFPVALISYSLLYARQFLGIPNISFNIKQKALMGPGGTQFLAEVKDAQRQIFVWTINEESFMRWSTRNEVDGVITDDPELFQGVCDEWEGNRLGYAGDTDGALNKDDKITILQRINVLMAAVVMFMLGGVFSIAHPVDLKAFTAKPSNDNVGSGEH